MRKKNIFFSFVFCAKGETTSTRGWCKRQPSLLRFFFALRVKQRQPEVGENVNRLYYEYGSNVNLWCFRVSWVLVGCVRFARVPSMCLLIVYYFCAKGETTSTRGL